MRGYGATVAPPPEEVLRLADPKAVLREEQETRERIERLVLERNCLGVNAEEVIDGIMATLRAARVFEQRALVRAA